MRTHWIRGSRITAMTAGLAIVALLLAACGDEEDADEETTVSVRLQEFAVIPARASVPAGTVTFTAQNAGPDDKHELVVIRTDLAPDALPVSADGSVNEAGTGVQVIGEIEEFEPQQTKNVTFDLSAGKYALICNVVEQEDGKTEAHYKLGMRTAFTVT